MTTAVSSAGSRHARDLMMLCCSSRQTSGRYTYYQGNDRNLYPLRYRPERYDQVAQQLEAITAAHPRLFVIYYGEREADPEGWYEQWLNANAFKAHEHWVGNVRVAVYGSSQLALQTLDLKAPIRFGEAIALVGAHVGRPLGALATCCRWNFIGRR